MDREVAFLYQMLKREKRKLSARVTPFKIAILDTGYDENTPTFDIPGRSRRVRQWKDFVSCSPHPIEQVCSMAVSVTLLLQLECPADIYVGRVTENSRICPLVSPDTCTKSGTPLLMRFTSSGALSRSSRQRTTMDLTAGRCFRPT